ncbi:lytic polysaccharide monooxygenase [Planosporangium thailandense]|uniref:Lytic polysaccharide monooxygenase n=1 Tax=Planosporangium thailandense TaxID=765197 RepID=A0ABX0YAI1_9ACTN|nr:lytic polysaccharide monooxygenase [Planosporangium thailandense]NJC74244.1 lytic polysaccharide monooxygenase [Planosporangium thailandense]
MAVPRTLARIALVVTAVALPTGLVTAPALAHGALDSPVSRAVACGPDGGAGAQSAACKAAVAISGTTPFVQWDNLRVANVGWRDRQVIPDGKLCSGGLPAYRGLDLPRADWPATRLAAGANFTFTYRETIPHKGTFRLYVTKDGYDPTKPLTWSDLEVKPFLTATDPPIQGDAYVMRGQLPAGKSGHHLIYTIWQNSSTPDTYYSCSDVIFGPAAATRTAAPTTPAAQPPAAAAADSAAPAAADQPQPSRTGGPATVALTRIGSTSGAAPMMAAGAAVLLAVALGAGGFWLRRRRAPQ